MKRSVILTLEDAWILVNQISVGNVPLIQMIGLQLAFRLAVTTNMTKT
jgi:hypothetical protein